MLITSQTELNSLCKNLHQHKSIAIDTEFVRRSTYYPKLSIVQICDSSGNIYVLDAIKTNILPFKEILQNPKILKILHAPLQDFENFYIHFKTLPTNVFDTQTASKFAGFRSNTSYRELCKAICNIDIDKSHQQSDWLQRPLGPLMIEYAKEDVKHLHNIYNYLLPKIINNTDYNAEIQKLLDPLSYKVNLETAWKKIKCRTNCNTAQSRYRLSELAAFREEAASNLDIPRSHFLSDETLVILCKTLPTKELDLHITKQKTNWIHQEKYKQKLFNLCQALKMTHS